MTDIAMTTTAQARPARRYGLWATVGGALTVASLVGVWAIWRFGFKPGAMDQRMCCWIAVVLGTISVAASGLAIASLNARERTVKRWLWVWMIKSAKRLLLALQIAAGLVAASAAAVLVFEFKLPR